MRGGEDGQALVEAAFVLPAFILLLLLTIQLTQLQRARLLAGYAAFAAARTGIVQDGNNGSGSGTDGPMHDAAVLAVLPGFGATNSFGAIARTRLRFAAQDAALRALGLPLLRVEVLNPTRAGFTQFGEHLGGEEIDFDDVRPGATEATLLSLRVRYLYELKVPFANQVLETLWLLARARAGSGEVAPFAAAAGLRRYFLPVEALYTMRMQSNPFRRWAHP